MEIQHTQGGRNSMRFALTEHREDDAHLVVEHLWSNARVFATPALRCQQCPLPWTDAGATIHDSTSKFEAKVNEFEILLRHRRSHPWNKNVEGNMC